MLSDPKNHPHLDVIIPVKDRTTVRDCIGQLCAEAAKATGFSLRQILLCDGDSQTANCREQLEAVAQWDKVEWLSCISPEFTSGFNKGWLLNQGLAATTAPLILISDVDILWNRDSLSELTIAASRNSNHLYYVQSVQESEPNNEAVQRPRYSYRIEQQEQDSLVEIYEDSSKTSSEHTSSMSLRPGCGLVCGHRSCFEQLGGYRHCFRGWGWEDQDLLMRAQLLDFGLGQGGWVTHLSHGDEQRNALSTEQSVQKSRDLNILRCLDALTSGQLQGDWGQVSPRTAVQSSSPRIRTRIPTALQVLANIQGQYSG